MTRSDVERAAILTSVHPRTFALAVLLAASPAVAQGRTTRVVPTALRDAVVGCWTIDAGHTMEVTRTGRLGLRATHRFSTPPLGLAPRRVWVEEVRYDPAGGTLGISTPTHIHGGWIVLRVRDGQVVASFFSRGHGGHPLTGAQDVVLGRCR